jgi:hypothetical protein
MLASSDAKVEVVGQKPQISDSLFPGIPAKDKSLRNIVFNEI